MRPTSEATLAEAIRDARGPLDIRGGGTRVTWRPQGGAELSTTGLSGIELYEPGALTLVVAAGTPVADVKSVLSEKGQRLPFEPPDLRALMGTQGAPTIGGVIAANASGPRRVQVGAARDFLLGVRFVDGSGAVVSNGGRVMKNVTGYDLVKLMAGSHGTLGVLSEVSLKVLARPRRSVTLVATGHDRAAGLALLRKALATPFDVSGACYDATGPEARTLIRVEGLDRSAGYRADRLKAALGGDWTSAEGAASDAIWRDMRDVTPFAGTDGTVWRVSTRPTDAAALMDRLAQSGVQARALHDWGGGLSWIEVTAAPDGGAAALRAAVRDLGGHATLIRANDTIRANVPMFQPEAPGVARLTAGLRAKFDPRGILNPGLMTAQEATA